MKRALVVGAVLWGAALALSGVVVAGTVTPTTVEDGAANATQTLEDGVVTLTGFGGDVWVAMSNNSVSARASSGETTVGLEGLGTENASGSLSSPALGDGASESLSTGLCAAGLSRPESPLDIDPEGERVSVDFEEYAGPNTREGTASEVVAACSR